MQQLNDPVYYEKQRLKVEEEKRLAQEAEENVRRETPGTRIVLKDYMLQL
jgi:hypothetical protein